MSIKWQETDDRITWQSHEETDRPLLTSQSIKWWKPTINFRLFPGLIVWPVFRCLVLSDRPENLETVRETIRSVHTVCPQRVSPRLSPGRTDLVLLRCSDLVPQDFSFNISAFRASTHFIKGAFGCFGLFWFQIIRQTSHRLFSSDSR